MALNLNAKYLNTKIYKSKLIKLSFLIKFKARFEAIPLSIESDNYHVL